LDWGLILFHLEKMAVAYALALPIGWERERFDRSAGLRTFPLVAIAACGYVLIAENVLGGSPEARARVMEGVITGMGFIGGGAILKSGMSVKGTATAASIWNTGAIGTASAFERYEVAVILALVNFLTLRVLAPFKSEPDDPEGGSQPQEEETAGAGHKP
jgi:putative Mg2+ transporter-C (MgtC) family protein